MAKNQLASKRASLQEKNLVAWRITVEGKYYGKNAIERYEAELLVPSDYNNNGRGLTYVRRCLLGKIDGQPALIKYKDKSGKTPYADYRQLQTANITDWQEVFDTNEADQIIKEKKPSQMVVDELKRALTRVGITYPNPARKSELVALLEKATAAGINVNEEGEERPDFGAYDRGIPPLPEGEDGVESEVIYDNSDVDEKTGLPKYSDKSVDSFST